ncbi:MAG: glycosyltransferase family 9 protein [Opitutae bacterium]|nr:glycosyltransferase family 9 protein [Opitutae bacterium]
MQSNSTPHRARRARLLVVELWGLGDLALAVPFLREVSRHAHVSLLAKPHAAPLLRRFAPNVELIPLVAPWTAFRNKYDLASWPWAAMREAISTLRARRFDAAVSARRDPRDHALMALSDAALRAGFPWSTSRALLTDPIATPARPHRARHWEALATHFGWELSAPQPEPRRGNHVVIHTGAGQSVREWPRERFEELAARLRTARWRVTIVDDTLRDLDVLLDTLASADRFIGNDSGPGHLAAAFGVPTFTIFGPQLPELFAPQHPQATWIDGAACAYKPCFDSCRFGSPHCIRELSTHQVATAVDAWLTKS